MAVLVRPAAFALSVTDVGELTGVVAMVNSAEVAPAGITTLRRDARYRGIAARESGKTPARRRGPIEGGEAFRRRSARNRDCRERDRGQQAGTGSARARLEANLGRNGEWETDHDSFAIHLVLGGAILGARSRGRRDFDRIFAHHLAHPATTSDAPL